ncbi:acyltransferase family protein [Donghicola mangrovi]|uniref:Acyltransferase n=1 Tax=Donghicola mangrovi TaxID=2729614 RepID=A0A850Q9Y4_9RHOB|nr:acyltransferase [Donghicola mangrovi]NVO25743.1 acyltransferase [Donghicola mangrovi]
MNYINNFRAYAILTIILVHVSGIIRDDVGSIYIILESIVKNGTFQFVIIAGFLFSASSSDFKYAPYLRNKFTSVVLPYIFISIPAILLDVLKIKTHHAWVDMDWLYSLPIWQEVLYFYVTGSHLGPLWFVPMIVIFYLASPFFNAIKNRLDLLLLAFVIAGILGAFLGRPTFDQNSLQAFVYFMPAFLLGQIFYLKKELFTRQGRWCFLITLAGWPGLIATQYGQDIDGLPGVDLLFLVIFNTGAMGIFYRYLNGWNRWVDLFARISFYLFFAHGYLVGALREIYGRALDHGMSPWVFVIFGFAVTVLGCLAGYVVVKMLLGRRSRIFIGA